MYSLYKTVNQYICMKIFILPKIHIVNNSKAYTNLVFWDSLVCSLG